MPDKTKKNTVVINSSMLKRDARSNLKRHYIFYVFACLLAIIIEAEFIASDYLINMRTNVIDYAFNTTEEYLDIDQKTEETVRDGVESIDKKSDVFRQSVIEYLDRFNGNIKDPEIAKMFGRTKGVLNQMIDYVAGDTFVSHMYSTVFSIVGDHKAANIAVSVIMWILVFVFWLFVRNLFVASIRRIFLEGRIYKKVPMARYLFFIRMKRWTRSAFTMGILWIIEFLSSFTIVLYPVVRYGFFLVPFIIAENPDIKTADALKLSWRMMKGNKFNLFKISVSLIGWYVLGILTLGLSGMLFTNPYRICVYSEFYDRVREAAKENGVKGSEMLNDVYLFVKADSNRLMDAYSDVLDELSQGKYSLEGLKGKKKFFADHFGVVLWNIKDEMEYEANEERRMKLLAYKNEAEGEIYPSRLSPVPEQRKLKSLAHIHYMRHYSVPSLAALFFIFSSFGWAWEVSLCYVQQGILVNRGVLHGPWLPIYGTGGLIVLIFLFVFRRRPALHALATVVLCGVVEYIGGWALESIFHEKWWDYSGFFLNINGRVCAEGLFVFGIAGMAFIYVLSPLLDNLIRKANQKILLPVLAVLIACFAADIVYSRFVPNKGEGITDEIESTAILESVEGSKQLK